MLCGREGKAPAAAGQIKTDSRISTGCPFFVQAGSRLSVVPGRMGHEGDHREDLQTAGQHVEDQDDLGQDA